MTGLGSQDLPLRGPEGSETGERCSHKRPWAACQGPGTRRPFRAILPRARQTGPAATHLTQLLLRRLFTLVRRLSSVEAASKSLLLELRFFSPSGAMRWQDAPCSRRGLGTSAAAAGHGEQAFPVMQSHSLTYCPWLLPCCSGGDEGLCQSCKRKFASDPPR